MLLVCGGEFGGDGGWEAAFCLFVYRRVEVSEGGEKVKEVGGSKLSRQGSGSEGLHV